MARRLGGGSQVLARLARARSALQGVDRPNPLPHEPLDQPGRPPFARGHRFEMAAFGAYRR